MVLIDELAALFLEIFYCRDDCAFFTKYKSQAMVISYR